MSKNPAVNVAKNQKNVPDDGVITSSTGIKIRIKPVATGLIQDTIAQIPDPAVPMWFNEDKGREEPNPNDPAYIKAKSDTQKLRANATVDAMIIFGVELIDPIPPLSEWVPQVKYMKRYNPDIQVNEDDEFELELAYKKYIAIGSDDFQLISRMAGVTQEAVKEQLKNFPD